MFVYSTSTPKTICIANAPATARTLIERLFSENAKAIASSTTMPPMPQRICKLFTPFAGPGGPQLLPCEIPNDGIPQTRFLR